MNSPFIVLLTRWVEVFQKLREIKLVLKGLLVVPWSLPYQLLVTLGQMLRHLPSVSDKLPPK